MKRIIIISMLCLTLSCASTQAIKTAEKDTVEPTQSETPEIIKDVLQDVGAWAIGHELLPAILF